MCDAASGRRQYQDSNFPTIVKGRFCICQDETVSTMWRAGVIPLNTRTGRQLPRFIALGCIFLLLCGILAALWVELTTDEKLLLRRILEEHPALILTAAFLFPFAVVIAVVWVFRHYIEPLGRLVDDVQVMNLVNPSHRLTGTGSTQVRQLCAAINRALDRLQDLQLNADDQARDSRRQVEEEKAVLEALIQDFSDGVIVCNVEGQILLYNKRARELLAHEDQPRESQSPPAGYVGLGRSVFGFIDRDLIVHALEMIDRSVRKGEGRAMAPFVTKGSGGELLHVEATPVLAGSMEIRGTVLLLRVESSGHRWPLEEMLCNDVAAAVKQRAEQSLDVKMALQPSIEQILVRVDGFTMVQALVYLTASMKSASGGTEFGIRPLRNESLASLDILWRGKPLPAATLREWEQSRIRIAGEEIPVTLAEVFKRHDAELSSGADPDATHAYLRVVLPSCEVAGGRGGWQSPATLKSRPEFYDFDLFALPPGSLPLGERTLTEIPFTAFDTETTGLRPSEGDEIVSIGGVRIVNGRMLREETFDRLIDPGRPISRESTQVHGIDDAMVQGQPDIRGVLAAFSRFAQDTVLVGHNAAFDMRFFQIKEEPTGVKLRMPVLDTILLSAVVHPRHEDHSIEGIAGRLGVNIVGRHTALGDAIVTGELFLKLIPLLADKGIRTLEEAVEASKRTYLARVKY